MLGPARGWEKTKQVLNLFQNLLDLKTEGERMQKSDQKISKVKKVWKSLVRFFFSPFPGPWPHPEHPRVQNEKNIAFPLIFVSPSSAPTLNRYTTLEKSYWLYLESYISCSLHHEHLCLHPPVNLDGSSLLNKHYITPSMSSQDQNTIQKFIVREGPFQFPFSLDRLLANQKLRMQ